MCRRGSLRRLGVIGATSLCLLGGCYLPTQALLRRPQTLPAGRIGASVSGGVYLIDLGAVSPFPDVTIGLRHALGARVDGGVSLSLDGGLVADVQVEVHQGPSLAISLDPRVSISAPLLLTGGTGLSPSVGVTLPATLGVALGSSELIFGPLVSGFRLQAYSLDQWVVLVGGGVGIDLAVGSVFLVPELDLTCPAVGGLVPDGLGGTRYLGCIGHLAVSFHD